MSNIILQTEYRGANLKLELAENNLASLTINGINRCQENASTGVVKLSSTVQTDYEWHEFIEGLITFEANSITLTITANNSEVAQQTFTTSPTR